MNGEGAASGMTHSMPLRVYYEDTDGAGIVYYANYLKFAERGRTEMMRTLGFAHSRIQAETGIVFTVRRLAADYREPARLDDALSVDTRIVEIGGPSCSTSRSAATARCWSRSTCSSPVSGATAGRAGCRRTCAPRSPHSDRPWPCRAPSRASPQPSSKRRHKRPPSMQPLETTALPGTVTPTLSIFELFLQSDTIVKLAMLLLLVASFWSWAVIFDKTLRLRRLRQAAESFEENFWSGGSLDDLYDRVGQRPVDPMSAVFAAAMREWRRSAAKGLLGTALMRASLQQRIERVMNVTVGREMDRVERFMSFLATVGSTAPFVGLFGTVWGIMDSFQSIAASKNTSLAVVAPGIAESLFATALGLVAAIPAVVAYNKLSSDFGRYAGRLEAFATEFSAILSRQLDERP